MRDKANYQICARCVMDTTDPKIQFDVNGVCDHCRSYDQHIAPVWNLENGGEENIEAIVSRVKSRARTSDDYDCILGLSGGVDSSWLLHCAVAEWGLRPLVFHVDAGWNSDIAVSNIHNLVEKLGLDLVTEVTDWDQVRNLQLALFRSGTPHLDLSQDMAFFGTMFKFCEKYGIKTILNGGNYSTECVRNPKDWIYYGTDLRFLDDLLNKFGDPEVDMSTFPFSGVLYHRFYLKYVKRIHVERPLNSFRYIKSEAIHKLNELYDWKPYPQKHFESRFTKFYEGWWLPERFGFDTRRVQFSSLILTGQMQRSEALKLLRRKSYPSELAEQDFEYVADKLGIPPIELQGYFDAPKKSYRDYRNQETLFNVGAWVLNKLGVERMKKR
jgi:N-acetyl sugar amidotransferase